MKKTTGCARLTIAVGLLTLLCSCAGMSPRTDSSEAVLKERVETFWKLRLAGKHAETYPFETPETREKVSLTVYVMTFGGAGNLLDAKVDSVSVDGDRGTAQLTLRYLFVGGFTPKDGITRTVGDYWQKIDGQWYHLLHAPPSVKKPPPTRKDYDKMRELRGLPVPSRAPAPAAQ